MLLLGQLNRRIREGRGYDGGYITSRILTHLGADRIKERLPGIRQIAMDFANVDPINDSGSRSNQASTTPWEESM